MTKIFHDFPAYAVVEGTMRKHVVNDEVVDLLELVSGDDVALVSDPHRHYQAGSVVSYAMRYGECPIKAVERAKGFGHELHYLFALATCLHNGPVVKHRYIGIEHGQMIRFEGRIFTIQPAPNQNVKLVEVLETVAA